MPTVTLIMIDGLRPDAIELADTPHIHSLMQHGAFTLTAQSVMPSITLPCHTSIFYSIPPARHGITTNTWSPMARPIPGIVEQAKSTGKTCAFFYSWEPLRDMSQPENLMLSYYRLSDPYDLDSDDPILAAVLDFRSRDHVDFVFLYFSTTDIAGHKFGWMSDGYLKQVEHVDMLLGHYLAILDEEDSVVLQSDHGGHERSHGTESREDMTIPWLAMGKNIRHNHAIQSAVTLLDTAPTLARMLDIRPHPAWEGRCVDDIFGSDMTD
jgi:predicted AlkP superfamily pyrophosphatase or phosphodiesterase